MSANRLKPSHFSKHWRNVREPSSSILPAASAPFTVRSPSITCVNVRTSVLTRRFTSKPGSVGHRSVSAPSLVSHQRRLEAG
jgi:hypothetical protein